MKLKLPQLLIASYIMESGGESTPGADFSPSCHIAPSTAGGGYDPLLMGNLILSELRQLTRRVGLIVQVQCLVTTSRSRILRTLTTKKKTRENYNQTFWAGMITISY